MSTLGTRGHPRPGPIISSVFALFFAFLTPSFLLASSTTINGVPDQLTTQGAGVSSQGMMVGVSTFGASIAGEFSFQLPPLPYPQRVVSATLTLKVSTLSYGPPTTFNADLYALPARTSSTPLMSDFFTGPFATDPAAFSLLDNALTPSVGFPYTTVTVSPVDLAWYINGQYDRGLQPSSTYLFLRFSPDFTSRPVDGLNVYSFISPATLTLATAVPFPEPATAGLATMAVAVTVLRRRPHPRRSRRDHYSRTARPS